MKMHLLNIMLQMDVTVVLTETFLFGGNMVRKQSASTTKCLVQELPVIRKIHRHLTLTFMQT